MPAQITDPANALQSFQQELLAHGLTELRRGVFDRDLYVYFDYPNGERRATYVRLEGNTVTALVMFCLSDPIKGMPCFGVGYAVPEEYRNQGRAKEAITAAIAELQHNLSQQGFRVFYVEAIVAADNQSSRRVAEQVISDTPTAITEHISGLPAYQYVKKVEQKQSKRKAKPRPREKAV